MLLVVIGSAVYWNSVTGPFIFDDQPTIVSNPGIRVLWNSRVLFPPRELPVAGRPVVNISFAVNYALGQLDVRGYHVWNIVVHLCCALLVFGLVHRTLELPRLFARWSRRAVDVALVVALVWMVHPLNSEAVDYLTQRTESMMAACYLLMLYCGVRAFRSAHPLRWRGAAVAACWLGMACKESMVTAPVMLVLYDAVYVYGSLKHALRDRWPFYAAIASAWIGLAMLLSTGPRIYTVGFSTGVSSWTYVLNQTVIVAHYLRLAIWPRSLVLAYGWPVPMTFAAIAPYGLAIACLLFGTVAAFVWKPDFGFLGAWIWITLAPTSSFVPIATEVGAERRMYLPLIGIVTLVVIVAVVAERWMRPWFALKSVTGGFATRLARAAPLTAVVLIAAVLGACTVARNREYATSLGLARTVLDRWPSSFAHHMIGTELAAAGRRNEGMVHLRQALPGFPKARYNLGWELYQAGRLDEAIQQLQQFVRDEPVAPEVLSAWETMGRAFADQGRWPEAIEQFRRVLALTPDNRDVHGRLADALFASGTFDEAASHYRAYLMVHPDDRGALSNFGIALVATGRIDEAIGVFKRRIDTAPDDASAHRNLATVLFDRQDVDGAAFEAQQVVHLTPSDPIARDLLGRALALQGRLDDARSQFEEAISLDPTYAQARDDLARVEGVRSVLSRTRK